MEFFARTFFVLNRNNGPEIVLPNFKQLFKHLFFNVQ